MTHFEVHAVDPPGTLEFYQKVFGWKAAKWDGPRDYWIFTTGDDHTPGINGGMMLSPDSTPRTVMVIQVESVDSSCESVVQHGGEIVVPKTSVHGVGFLAYCRSPDGLLFGLFHNDTTAGS